MTGNDNSSFELISAYLDGELSVEERAQVEELLAGSEAHRTLLEELQSLRTEFSSLAPVKPSGDLTSRIMAAVESAPAPVPTEDEPAGSVPATQLSSEVDVQWRVSWTQVVVAATTLLVLYGAYWASTRERADGPHIAVEDPKGDGSKDDGSKDDGPKDDGPKDDGPKIAVQEGHPKVGPEDPVVPKPDELPDTPGVPDLAGGQFVFAEQKTDIMLVLEYAVDPKVLKDKVYKKTLMMHGIAVDDEIVPDAVARKSILESRAFSPGKVKPRGREQGPGGSIEFSIVIADIDRLFQISETLRTAKGVRGLHIDLSFYESDKAMIRELGRLRDDQFADVKTGKAGRAYLVSLRDDVQSALRGLSTAVAFSPVISELNLGPVKAMAPADIADDSKMPVVFILRSVAPAK